MSSDWYSLVRKLMVKKGLPLVLVKMREDRASVRSISE
jgi:hypothetical protein